MSGELIAKSFGFELEGGWNKPPIDFKDDCSVELDDEGGNFIEYCSCGCGEVTGGIFPGEVASPVFYRSGRDDYGNAWGWINSNFPDVSNHTCGFHVHVGIDHDSLWRYVEREFTDHLIHQLRLWGVEKNIPDHHDFWRRLMDDSYFACPRWPGGLSVVAGLEGYGGSRYRALNFMAYPQHGTLEVRSLPMFNSIVTSISAVKKVLSIFDNYRPVVGWRAGAADDVDEHTLAAVAGTGLFNTTRIVLD